MLVLVLVVVVVVVVVRVREDGVYIRDGGGAAKVACPVHSQHLSSWVIMNQYYYYCYSSLVSSPILLISFN